MRSAGVMLIIKDGLILAVSRKNNLNSFGLAGGKAESKETPEMAAIRETFEETNITVHDCSLIYERIEPPSHIGGESFHVCAYYSCNWSGELKRSEEGVVKWITEAELTSDAGSFPEYNKNTLNAFKKLFPDIYIK